MKMNLHLMVFIQEIIYLKLRMGHIINLGEYKSIETHWIVFYVNDYNITYFDSFRVEHIPKKLKKSLEVKIL